jgi:hypothetical protein
MQRRLAVAAVCMFLTIPTARADERGPQFVRESSGIRDIEPPRTAIAALAQVEPDVVLGPPPARLVDRETEPPTVGTVRTIVQARAVDSTPRSFRSTGAVRVRLRLANVFLPPGSVAWVIGAEDDAVPFGNELLHQGTLWTPSVDGDTIRLLLPEGGRAEVTSIGHIARNVTANGLECLVDASCASFDDGALSSSVAALFFVQDNSLVYCSGGLVNAVTGVSDRLMLTANHCIDTQAEAASVEAYWDLRTTSCNGPQAAFQRTDGASLLVTSAATDVTLLRMNSVPGGRMEMGWSSAAVEPGTLLYRISHPFNPATNEASLQMYAITRATNTVQVCDSEVPHSRYLYSSRVTGSVGDGSSGAPVIKTGGFVVGQTAFLCFYGSANDECATSTLMLDGSIRASYPLLQPFLNPGPSNGCTPNSTTVCLLGNRFRVSVNYRNQFANPAQPGDFVAARLNSSAVNPDVGIFGLSDPQATEIMVRIADARPFAPRFDVYYGGLTDLEYWVNVTDTVTGTNRSYHNPAGRLGAGLDRTSFPAN